MSDYQRREDLALVPDLLGLAATEGRAFLTFNNSIERGDGEIPRKYRELIALGYADAMVRKHEILDFLGVPKS